MLLWCRSLLCSPNRQVYPLFHQPHGQQPEYPQMYPLPDFWKLNVNLTLLSWSLCQFFHTPTSIYLPLNFVRQDFQRYWNLRVRQIKDCSSLLPFAGSCSGGPWVEADCGSWKRHWGWGGGYKKNTRMTSSIKSHVQAYTLFYKGRVQKKLEFSNFLEDHPLKLEKFHISSLRKWVMTLLKSHYPIHTKIFRLWLCTVGLWNSNSEKNGSEKSKQT